jgi:hypothetical protein
MHNATGGFPPELATPGLQGLYLSKANLSGPLPGLANMTSLREAILDGNRFTGVSFRKRNVYTQLCGCPDRALVVLGVIANPCVDACKSVGCLDSECLASCLALLLY